MEEKVLGGVGLVTSCPFIVYQVGSQNDLLGLGFWGWAEPATKVTICFFNHQAIHPASPQAVKTNKQTPAQWCQ